MKYLGLLVLAVVASGCAPTVVGNDQSALINAFWSVSPDQDAFEAATKFCAARGRGAILVSKNSREAEYNFRCGE